MPSAKSISVAPSAITRAFCARPASLPGANNIHSAAAGGTASRTERIGKPSAFISLSYHRPGCGSGNAKQHHQRIGIDIAGLEPPGRDAAARHHGGHAVGAEAVDRADVALLPEEPADSERRTHEDRKSPRLNSKSPMRISYACFCLNKH